MDTGRLVEGRREPGCEGVFTECGETEVLAWVYVFVCTNVCEACECICMHMCVHVNMCICECACVYVCTCVCRYVCACVWVCMGVGVCRCGGCAGVCVWRT